MSISKMSTYESHFPSIVVGNRATIPNTWSGNHLFTQEKAYNATAVLNDREHRKQEATLVRTLMDHLGEKWYILVEDSAQDCSTARTMRARDREIEQEIIKMNLQEDAIRKRQNQELVEEMKESLSPQAFNHWLKRAK